MLNRQTHHFCKINIKLNSDVITDGHFKLCQRFHFKLFKGTFAFCFDFFKRAEIDVFEFFKYCTIVLNKKQSKIK